MGKPDQQLDQHKPLSPTRKALHTAVSILLVAVLATAPGLIGVGGERVAEAAVPENQTNTKNFYADENDPEIAGPKIGPVDKRFASPEAARQTVAEMHRHHPRTSKPGGDGMVTTQATADPSVTAAALDPAVFGQWQKLSYPTKSPAIHVTYLRTGKFLLISGSGNSLETFNAGTFQAHVWNPKTGEMKSVTPPYDMFCAGHVVMPNGNVMVAGGTEQFKDPNNPWKGARKAYMFNTSTETWSQIASMRDGRWYPTNVLRGDGKVDVFAGRDLTGARNKIPERYNPATNTWTNLAGRSLPDYPGLKRMWDGRYVYAGARTGNSGIAPKIFNADTGAYTNLSGISALDQRNGAATVLAGPADKQWLWLAGGGFPATNSTVFLNLRATTPAGVAGPNLATAKGYVSALNLPNFEVLQTGGGTGTDTPVFETSIFNPWDKSLRPMAPNTVGRTYHSSAALLDDGRVVTFGGDPDGPAFELAIEIFSPPYLFKGTRPTITSAPTEIKYGTTYNIGATVADGTSFWSASLMRPVSTTHATDANERAVRLTMTNVTGGVQVTTTNLREIAPPGWYMFYLQDRLGRISVAKWVHLT